MTQTRKRAGSLLLAFAMLLSLCTGAFAAERGAEEALNRAAAHVYSAVPSPQVASIGGEWAVIGLARSGYDVPQSYWDGYYETVVNYVAERKGVLHEKKYTEYSRVVLALTAIGADPTDVAGYNLLTPLGDFDKTVWQGINGLIWALIALDSGDYEMPVNETAATQATRQMYVEEILSKQMPDGGWSLSGQGGADADVTAMALQALAPYQDQSKVKTAVERGLVGLSNLQGSDGGYSSGSAANAESVAQVVIALCTLSVDLNDIRFVKNGYTALDNLLSYQQENGGFRHTGSGGGNTQMAGEQALCALAAVNRAAAGKSALYEMNDVTICLSGQQSGTGLSGKHPDVCAVPVTAPGTTFADITGHKDQKAIETLAERGIINGGDGGRFSPNATMTRAEFCAIVVRALGLTPESTDDFSDVLSDKWYAPYIGTAYTCGIVNGIGGGKFAPNGTITRQEAAAMVARAAKLCGMDTERDDTQTRNILAQFGDYTTVASWAKPSVAFCYDADLLDQSDLDIRPGQAILRCEIAQMLCRLLDGAKLL